MITQQEIREKLLAFVRNDLSLDDFEDWLVQRSWNMHRDSEQSAQRLVSSIELALSEHSGGDITYADLRFRFDDLVSASVEVSPVTTITGAPAEGLLVNLASTAVVEEVVLSLLNPDSTAYRLVNRTRAQHSGPHLVIQ